MIDVAAAKDALRIAAKLSIEFDAGAAGRDVDRRLPHDQVKALKESGLPALSVLVDYGGAAAPAIVLADVFRLLAHARSVARQIPHSHFTFLEAL